MNSAPLSYRLVQRREELFEDIKRSIGEKKRLKFSINLLIGLIDYSLPLYYLSDIPEHDILWEQREELRKQALQFIHKNFLLFLELLASKDLQIDEQEDVLYILGKSAKELLLEPDDYMKMAFVVLDLLLRKESRLAKQLLCRYDFGCLVEAAGFGSCEKAPYKEILEKLEDQEDQYYKLISEYMSKKVAITRDNFEKKVESLLYELPIDHYDKVKEITMRCYEKSIKNFSFDLTMDKQLIYETQRENIAGIQNKAIQLELKEEKEE